MTTRTEHKNRTRLPFAPLTWDGQNELDTELRLTIGRHVALWGWEGLDYTREAYPNLANDLRELAWRREWRTSEHRAGRKSW